MKENMTRENRILKTFKTSFHPTNGEEDVKQEMARVVFTALHRITKGLGFTAIPIVHLSCQFGISNYHLGHPLILFIALQGRVRGKRTEEPVERCKMVR